MCVCAGNLFVFLLDEAANLWTLAVVVLMGRPKLELVGCFADQ